MEDEPINLIGCDTIVNSPSNALINGHCVAAAIPIKAAHTLRKDQTAP